MVEDMIIDSLVSSDIESGAVFTYVNVNKARYSGIELQGRWIATKRFLFSWGYTYAFNTNLTSNEQIANHPTHSFNFRASNQSLNGKLNQSIKIKSVLSYPIDEFVVETADMERKNRPGYTIIDYDFRYQINRIIELSAGIKNLLNKKNQNFGPFIGRTAYFEITTKIKGKHK